MKMTPEERREERLYRLETDIALLDRIAAGREEALEKGRTATPSREWVAFHRRQVVKKLEELRRFLPQAERMLADETAKLERERAA